MALTERMVSYWRQAVVSAGAVPPSRGSGHMQDQALSMIGQLVTANGGTPQPLLGMSWNGKYIRRLEELATAKGLTPGSGGSMNWNRRVEQLLSEIALAGASGGVPQMTLLTASDIGSLVDPSAYLDAAASVMDGSGSLTIQHGVGLSQPALTDGWTENVPHWVFPIRDIWPDWDLKSALRMRIVLETWATNNSKTGIGIALWGIANDEGAGLYIGDTNATLIGIGNQTRISSAVRRTTTADYVEITLTPVHDRFSYSIESFTGGSPDYIIASPSSLFTETDPDNFRIQISSMQTSGADATPGDTRIYKFYTSSWALPADP